MMYVSGCVKPVYYRHTCKGVEYFGIRYVCTIKTPRVHVMKSSTRSRMEAMTEALKYLGLPLYSTR